MQTPVLGDSSPGEEGCLRGGGFLLVCNICKPNNVMALLRCAAAFDFFPLIVDKGCRPPPGRVFVSEEVKLVHSEDSSATVRCLRFPTLSLCEQWVRGRGLMVVGIEILEQARSLRDPPFPHSSQGVVLVPGNESSGLVDRLRRLCDGFVYIPQFGRGTASLNVHTATALVMHEYALRRRESTDGHSLLGSIPPP